MMPMGMMGEMDDGGMGGRFPQPGFPLGGIPRSPFDTNGNFLEQMGGGFPQHPGMPGMAGGFVDPGQGKGSRIRYAPDLSLDQLNENRNAQQRGGGKGGKGKGRGGKKGGAPEPMRVLSDFGGGQVHPLAGEMQGLPGGVPPIASLLPAGMSERQAIPPPSWADTTTIMMRNLPNKYTQRMLLTEVNQAGFLGTFDFLYLPIDPETSANRGYSFLNFIDPSFAWLFKMTYEGRKMNRFNSSKVVSVMPATLQGFDANYTHYSTARVNRGDPAARPLFLREPAQPVLKAVGRDNFNKRGNRRKGSGNSPGPAAPMTAAGEQFQPPFPKGDAPAGDRPSVPKFCPHCGGPIQAHFEFCPHCGSNVDFSNLKQY